MQELQEYKKYDDLIVANCLPTQSSKQRYKSSGILFLWGQWIGF